MDAERITAVLAAARQKTTWRPCPDDIAAAEDRMVAAGWLPHDPPTFNKLAMFLAYRHAGQARRGVILASPTNGNGKTLWLRSFAECRIVTAQQIAARWAEYGARETLDWLSPVPYDIVQPGHYALAIDEIGAEPIVNAHGTRSEPVGEAIAAAYARFSRRPEAVLYGTTNKTRDELAERYGGRVVSRIAEMATWIEVGGRDQRTANSED